VVCAGITCTDVPAAIDVLNTRYRLGLFCFFRDKTLQGTKVFGRPFVKRFALCYRTVVCLSDCDVGVLWPNGWMY